MFQSEIDKQFADSQRRSQVRREMSEPYNTYRLGAAIFWGAVLLAILIAVVLLIWG